MLAHISFDVLFREEISHRLHCGSLCAFLYPSLCIRGSLNSYLYSIIRFIDIIGLSNYAEQRLKPSQELSKTANKVIPPEGRNLEISEIVKIPSHLCSSEMTELKTLFAESWTGFALPFWSRFSGYYSQHKEGLPPVTARGELFSSRHSA